MNRLGLENNMLKLKTSGKLTDRCIGIQRIYLKLAKNHRKMSTYNRLDLESLGSGPLTPKILSEHWLDEWEVNALVSKYARISLSLSLCVPVPTQRAALLLQLWDWWYLWIICVQATWASVLQSLNLPYNTRLMAEEEEEREEGEELLGVFCLSVYLSVCLSKQVT